MQPPGAEAAGALEVTPTTKRTSLDRLRVFLQSGDKSQFAAHWLRRVVRESSPSSWLNVVVRPFWGRLGGGEMTTDHVLKVVQVLEGEGLRFWIAGGWGVDLLTGSPTRKHGDLDVLLANYDHDEPSASRALEVLGYRHARVTDDDTWMRPRHLLDDGQGHLVELLGLNRGRLVASLELIESSGQPVPIEERAPELFSSGTLGGRSVPCLSAQLQLLFHSGFDPRGIDKHDLDSLRALVPLHASTDATHSR